MYWMRIHVGMVGFSCPWGIGDFGTKLRLPEGTSLAIDLASSDPNDKVRCWNIASNGAETEVTNATWTYPADTSIRGDWCKSTTMPASTAQGYDLGYRMPARARSSSSTSRASTKRLAGMAGAGETTKAVAHPRVRTEQHLDTLPVGHGVRSSDVGDVPRAADHVGGRDDRAHDRHPQQLVPQGQGVHRPGPEGQGHLRRQRRADRHPVDVPRVDHPPGLVSARARHRAHLAPALRR
jgi:hypothetical protein